MTTLLLVLLASAYLRQYNWLYSAFLVSAILVLACVEYGIVRTSERGRGVVRLAVVTLVMFMLVVAPTVLQIVQRHNSAPYRYIHDGAIQTEEAVQFLLAGKNPYVESYAGTPMAGYDFSIFEVDVNPALEHNPYLPMTFLLPLPFFVVFQGLLGWFDLRFVFLFLFLLLWLVLPALTTTQNRDRLLVVTALNPLFVPFFIEGRNDIVVLLGVALALVALRGQAWTFAALVMGLAMTVKQTAWFLAPFFLLYLWDGPFGRKWDRRAGRALAAFVLPSILITLPFMLWEGRAFLDDAILFQSTSFPIWGYGLSEILLQLGFIPSRTASFPFWVLQLAAGLPLLALLLRRQMRANTLRTMLAAGASLTLAVGFLSRAFLDSHVGYCMALGLVAYFLEPSAT